VLGVRVGPWRISAGTRKGCTCTCVCFAVGAAAEWSGRPRNDPGFSVPLPQMTIRDGGC
jgi:hypothetical protein